LEFGVWSLEFGVWSLEFGVWSLEFGIKNQISTFNTQGRPDGRLFLFQHPFTV